MPQSTIETLYILSAGHSGSTLLNLIVGSHSRAAAVAELTRLPANIAHNAPCTCGAAIRDCVQWREVRAHLQARLGIDVFADPYLLQLGYIGAPRGIYRGSLPYRVLWKWRRSARYVTQFIGFRGQADDEVQNRLAVYGAVRSASGASLIIDASKGYLPGIALYQARPAATRQVLLTRDGRAVFHSNLKRGFGRPYSMKIWRNYYLYGLPLISKNVNPDHVLHV